MNMPDSSITPSSSTLHSNSQHELPPRVAPPHHQKALSQPALLPSTSRPTAPQPSAKTFSFKLPFQYYRQSSATLAPSTAEGKPIPVDNSVVEHRTSALRELNSHYPSRHRYAKSASAHSTTYSEPVLVRSYYTPAPSRIGSSSHHRGVFVNRAHPTTASGQEGFAIGTKRLFEAASSGSAASTNNGMLSGATRARAKRLLGWGPEPEEPRLPPVESFTFQSFMRNLDGQDDISADLDRIAEICAKSRFSLSNQYEVHYQPHGSASSFLTHPGEQHTQGPTLQAVNPDEEHSHTSTRRRRGLARRNSRAVGTLETIISTSRSSDEDKSRKQSASELADQVRSRAVRHEPGSRHSSTSQSSPGSTHSCEPIVEPDASVSDPPPTRAERRNSSLALIDGPNNISSTEEPCLPQRSTTALASLPALPQASTSQLEIRTAGGITQVTSKTDRLPHSTVKEADHVRNTSDSRVSQHASTSTHPSFADSGVFSSLTTWLGRWSAESAPKQPSRRAESSLRELLRTTSNGSKATSNPL